MVSGRLSVVNRQLSVVSKAVVYGTITTHHSPKKTMDGRMLPLTVDDLLPLEEYAPKRKEYFDAHRRYVDRYRRVRIGPKLTLIFENRQTLWFRVQEVIRIARLADAADLHQELSLYNRLLPAGNVLQAALLIDIDP